MGRCCELFPRIRFYSGPANPSRLFPALRDPDFRYSFDDASFQSSLISKPVITSPAVITRRILPACEHLPQRPFSALALPIRFLFYRCFQNIVNLQSIHHLCSMPENTTYLYPNACVVARPDQPTKLFCIKLKSLFHGIVTSFAASFVPFSQDTWLSALFLDV